MGIGGPRWTQECQGELFVYQSHFSHCYRFSDPDLLEQSDSESLKDAHHIKMEVPLENGVRPDEMMDN